MRENAIQVIDALHSERLETNAHLRVADLHEIARLNDHPGLHSGQKLDPQVGQMLVDARQAVPPCRIGQAAPAQGLSYPASASPVVELSGPQRRLGVFQGLGKASKSSMDSGCSNAGL